MKDNTITPKILDMLEMKAPRYTSYPSAHHFNSINSRTYEEWVGKYNSNISYALYIHIPFCPQMCWFCGCNTKMTKRYEPVSSYVDILLKEFRLIEKKTGFRPKLHSVHFGGGSPTILNESDLSRIFYAIDNCFDVLENAEIAIEIDPRRVDENKIKTYAGLGFNRASLGVQDLNAKVQEIIGRIQPFEMVDNVCSWLIKYGINSISFDLIYGLPYQTLEGFLNTLERVISLKPNRLSCFSYAHVPWMKKHQTLLSEDDIPNTELKAKIYLNMLQVMKENGYEAIGIDHFSLKNDELSKAANEGNLKRNFMGYTVLENENVIALGASGISQTEFGFAQNATANAEYFEAINSEIFPTKRGFVFSGEDKIRAEIISHLMCNMKVDLNKITLKYNLDSNHFDKEISDLEIFQKINLIKIEDRKIVFESDLRMLIRPVCMVFDQYAEHGAKYSKVA